MAFARVHANETIVVAAPRLVSKLGVEVHRGLGEEAWQDTTLLMPCAGLWENLFTGERLEVHPQPSAPPTLAASRLFGRFAWALLAKLETETREIANR